MTPQEFKAWFDGFTEAFTGCPTKVQWTRIKARVAEIDGNPVTECIYVDRYWPTSYPLYPTYPRWHLGSAVGVSTYTADIVGLNLQNAQAASCNAVGNSQAVGTMFNSLQAMAELGRADAEGIQ